LILVPKLDGARELSELSLAQWMTLGTELRRASAVLVDLYRSYKINIAALGNNVQQLHVHVVGRNPDDPNWPGPIWGFGEAEHFTDSALQHQLENVRRAWHTERFSSLAT
jgi:diadenosine tetraphosphate (Ap4A) HIT family hydrolase